MQFMQLLRLIKGRYFHDIFKLSVYLLKQLITVGKLRYDGPLSLTWTRDSVKPTRNASSLSWRYQGSGF